MPDLDAISDQTYVTAGADFAFVLTRRGRLLTRHAPQEMPQEGRSRIIEASLSLSPGARFGHLELAREDLVPYGGAAPVEVYFGVATDHILCVVIPTWATREDVRPALEEGVRALDELAREGPRSARRPPKRPPSRQRMDTPPPSSRRPALPPEVIREEPPPSRPAAALQPSRKRSAVAGLASLASGGFTRSLARPAAQVAQAAPAPPPKPTSKPPPPPSRPPPPPPPPKPTSKPPPPPQQQQSRPPPPPPPPQQQQSRPPPPPPKPSSRPPPPPPPRRPAPMEVSLLDIRIGEATLGRESLAAIEQELGLARASLPDVRVGAAPVGRDTLIAIDAEVAEAARPGSAPDALRVELASISRESLAEIAAAEARQATAGPRPSMPLIRPMRMTQPWVEPAEDAKRAADAAARARKAAAPELDIEVIEPDTDVFEAALEDTGDHPTRKP